MSDQYTRISLGGTPMETNQPVVGLLFGEVEDHNNVFIRDAVDAPLTQSEPQVSLHTAVYSSHRVVGWYRVANESSPTPNDLVETQKLQHIYGPDLLFCLLQVDSESEDLPLSVFQIVDNTVLVNMTYKLETAQSERIAVDRVLKEQDSNEHPVRVSNNNLLTSIANLSERIEAIQSYLQSSENHDALDPTILRQIQALALQIGVLKSAKTSTSNSRRNDLQRLALLSKTIHNLQSYTDKMQALLDAVPSASVSRSRPYFKK